MDQFYIAIQNRHKKQGRQNISEISPLPKRPLEIYFLYDQLRGRDHMGLKESEEKISDLNAEINRLLKEREIILKEWKVAFKWG